MTELKTIQIVISNRKRRFVVFDCPLCNKKETRRMDVYKEIAKNICMDCVYKQRKETALVGVDNPNFVPFKKCVDCGCDLRNKLGESRVVSRCKECFNKYHTGKTHWNWKGGAKNENLAARKTKEYKEWAKAVKERDDYTCVICHKRGGELHSDHIKPFCEFKELRFDINNGRTLCVDCHYAHGWSFFKKKNPRKVKAPSTRHKSVYCVNTNKVYGSYLEAVKKTGVSRHGIHRVTSGRKKSAKGFVFIDFNNELLIF